MKHLCLGISLLFGSGFSTLFAYTDSTFFSQGGGDWSTVTWQTATGTAIQAGDDTNGQNNFVISDGHTVVLDQDISISSFTVGQGTSGTFTFGNDGTARTATIAGDVLVSTGGTMETHAIDGVHEIVFSGSSWSNNGTMTNMHRSDAQRTNLTINSSLIAVLSGANLLEFGAITLDGQATNGSVTVAQRVQARTSLTVQNTAQVTTSARWDVYGDYTLNANCSWNQSNERVYFSGTMNLNFIATPEFHDLQIDNGTATISGDFNVGRNFHLYDDAVATPGSGDGIYTIDNEFRVDGGTNFNLTGELHLTADADGQSFIRSNNNIINLSGIDVYIDGNTNTRGADGFLISNGDLRVLGGYFILNGTTNEHAAGANTDTLEVALGRILYLRETDNFPDNFGVYDLDENSTIRYDLNGPQIVRSLPGLTYGRIHVRYNTKTADGNLDIDGFLAFYDGAIFNMGSFDHTFAGVVVAGSGTLNSTGTFTMDAPTIDQDLRSGITFNFENLAIVNNAPTSSRFIDIETSINVNGNFTATNTGGNASRYLEVDMFANDITNDGDGAVSIGDNVWLRNDGASNFNDMVGSFSSTTLSSNSIVYFDGTDQTLPGNGSPANFNGTYGTIYLQGNGNKIPQGPMNVEGAVDSRGDNPLFTDNGFPHTVAGDWLLNFDQTVNMTGKVTMDGVDQTISQSNFDTLVFAGSGTKTIGADINVDGSLTVNNGVAVVTNDRIDLAGDLTISGTGTLQQNLETMELDGTLDQNISISTPTTSYFNILTINNAGGTVTALTGFTVKNNFNLTASAANFDLNGQSIFLERNWDMGTGTTFTPGGGTMNFTGNTDQDLHNRASAATIYPNMVFSGSGEKRFQNNNFDIDGDFTITSSTVDNLGQNVNISGNFNNAGGNYQGNGTTTFDGTAQSIDASDFYNFVTANSGVKSLDGAINVRNDLTIGSGTELDANGNDIQIERDWVNNNGGTFTSDNNTVIFVGNARNIFTGGTGAANTFYDVEFNLSLATTTCDLEGDFNIDGNLTILNGTFRTQTFDVFLAGSLEVQGEYQSNNNNSVLTFDGTSGTHTVNMGGLVSSVRDVVVNAPGAIYQLSADMDQVNNRTFTMQDGTWDLNGNTMTMVGGSGDITVSGGVFEIDSAASLEMSNNSDIFVTGGTFRIVGTATGTASMTSTSGNFGFTQNGAGATIEARYFSINGTNGGGMDIQAGSIDATNNFSNGTFTGGTGNAYLTVASGSFGASATIANCNFVNNAGNPTHNISHTAGQQIFMENSSGTRSGFTFEEDDEGTASQSSGLVQWTYPGGIFWDGASDGDGDGTSWEDFQNWTTDAPFSSTANLIIDHTFETNAISIDIDAATAEAGSLTLDDQGGSTIAITINGQKLDLGSGGISIGANCSVTQSGATDTIFVGGGWSNSGTFNEGLATVVFDDTTGTHTITTLGLNDPFNNILFNAGGTATSATYQLGNDLDANGAFTMNGGTFDVVNSSYIVRIGGDFVVNTGSIEPQNGTFRLDQGGTGTQNISSGSFYNLEIRNSGSGTNTKLLNGNIEVRNNLRIYTGSVLDGATNTIFIGRNWTNDVGTSAFTQTGIGAVIFNGTGVTQDIGTSSQATTFNNIYLQGTDGKNITADMNIDGNFYIISGIGTVNVSAGVTIDGNAGISNELNMTGGTLRINGANDFPVNFEEINLSGGNVYYRADIDQQVYPTTYYNLFLRATNDNSAVATTKTAQGSVVINNCLDIDDTQQTTFDMNDSTLTLNNNCFRVRTGGPQIDWGTPGGTGTLEVNTPWGADVDLTSFNNVDIDANGTVEVNSHWVLGGNLSVSANSILDMNAQKILSFEPNKSFSLAANAELRSQTAAPDTALPTGFTTYTLNENSEVDLNRNGDQILFTNGGTITYGGIDLNGGGTKTILDGNLDVNGVFDHNAGTFADNGFNINFGGDVVELSGFVASANTTQTFDGGGQNINDTRGGSQDINFNHLVISETGIKEFENDIINVAGDITINATSTLLLNENSVYSGNFTNLGTVDGSGFGDCATFSGISNQTIQPGSNHEFYCVIFDNGSPNTKSITGNGLDVGQGDFIVQADAVVDMGSLTHTIASEDFTINGTWTTDNANLTFDRAGGQNVPGLVQANDIVLAGSGTKTMTGDWQQVDDITISGGVTLDVSNGNDFGILTTGNWTNNGVFQDRQGTVEFESNDNTSKTIQSNGQPFFEITFNQGQTNTRTYSLLDEMIVHETGTLGSGATLDLNSQIFTLGNNDGGDPPGEEFTVEGGATLEIDSAATYRFNCNDDGGGASPAALTVDGTLRIVGSVLNPATMTREAGNDNYSVTINGNLEARYYAFQYLGQNGLNLTASSTVDNTNNLSDGSFSNMDVNSSFTYITIESDVSTWTDSIRNITFNHTGTPVIGQDFNLTRTRADGGIVNLANSVSGPLSGEDFDNDPNGDTRITFPVSTITTWTAGAGTSDWFTDGNWDNGVPDSTKDAIIPLVGPNPRINNTGAAAKSVTITDGFLSLDGGFDLDVKGDVNVGSTGAGILSVLNAGCQINLEGSWQVGGTAIFSNGGGTVEFDGPSGSQSIQANGQTFNNVLISGNTNVTINGDLDIDGNLTHSGGILNPSTNNYTINIAGDYNGTGGNFTTVTNGTVVLDGGGAQAITETSFDNLTVFGSGTKTFNGSILVADDITVNSNMVMAVGSVGDFDGDMNITVSGSFHDGGQTHTFGGLTWTQSGSWVADTGRIVFDRTAGGNQTINAATFNNLELASTRRIFLGGNLSIRDTFHITNSILDFRTSDFGVNNITGTGAFVMDAGENYYAEGLNSYPTNFSSYMVDPTSVTRFEGAADQNVYGGANVQYGNVYLTTTSTKTMQGDVIILGELQFRDATLDANNHNIAIFRDWENNALGSFIPGTGTVSFVGNFGSDFDRHNVESGIPANGSKSFYNVVVEKDLGTRLEITTESMTVQNDLTVRQGDLDLNGIAHYVGGNLDIQPNGDIDLNGTIEMTKTSGIATITSSSDTLFNLNLAPGSAEFRITDNMYVYGNLTVGAGATFNGQGNQVILGNSLNTVTIDGTYQVGAGGSMLIQGSGTVSTSSTGTIEVVGTEGAAAVVSRYTTGAYNFIVDGTIKAEYYLFEYMGTGGIQINSTATIDATNHFSNGTFSNPSPAGTCLRIENTQSFTGSDSIANVSFPVNPGSGATNVSKTSTLSGQLEFYSSQGTFSGENFDNDPNDLIDWTGPLKVIWNGSVSTDWFTANNWTPTFGPNIIPDSTIDAEIPFLVTQPVINMEGARVSTLTIEPGAILQINTSSDTAADLTVYTDINIDGQIQANSASDSVVAQGNWTRSATGTLVLGDSKVTFAPTTSTATLTNGINSQLPDVYVNATGSLNLGDDLRVNGDFIISTGQFNVTSNNYTVDLRGSFINGGTFIPQQGRVLFGSSSPTTINSGGSSFYDVEVDGNTTFSLASSDFSVQSSLILERGTFTSNGMNVFIGDNGGTTDQLELNGGVFSIGTNDTLFLGSNSTMIANSGANFSLLGTDIDNLAVVTNNGIGRYAFNIANGASIDARFYRFDYMNSNGIYVEQGATIDLTNNFSYGFFDNTPASGSILRIENNQDLSGNDRIEFVSFEGTEGSLSNIRKSVTATGNISVYWGYGSMEGEERDNDPNDLISWDANINWTGGSSTEWNNSANWDNTLPLVTNTFVPTAFTDVIIPSGGVTNEPTLSGTNGLADDLEIQTGRTLTITGGTDLTVDDTIIVASGAAMNIVTSGNTTEITLGGSWDVDGTFTPGTNSNVIFTAPNTQSLDNGANTFCGLTINSSNGVSGLIQSLSTIDVDCDFEITAGRLEITNPTHVMNVNGDWTNRNTTGNVGFIPGTGQVVLDGTSLQNIIHSGGSETFYDLRTSNPSIIRSFDTLSTHDLTIDNGAEIAGVGINLYISGDLINNNLAGNVGTFGITKTSFNGTTAQSILHAGGSNTMVTLEIANSSNTVTLNGNLNLSGDMIIRNNGTFDADGNQIVISGSWTNQNTVPNTGFIPGSGLIRFNGSSNVSITHNGGSEQFNNFSVNKISSTITQNASLDINGNFEVINNASVDGNGFNLTIARNFTNNNTTPGAGYTAGTGTLTFDGSSGPQNLGQLGDFQALNNLVILNTTGNLEVIGGTDLDINGNVTIADGAELDINGNLITLAGDWTNNNTVVSDGFTETGSTVTIDGNSQQVLSHGAGEERFFNLVINNTAVGTTSLLCNDTLVVGNTIQFIDGVVQTGPRGLWLTNTSPGALTGHSGTGYVFGNFRRSLASNTSTYDFPVGYGNSTSEYFLAQIINNNMTGISYLTVFPAPITEGGNNIDDSLRVQENEISYTNFAEDCEWVMIPDVQPTGGSYGVRLDFRNFTTPLTDNRFAPLKRPETSSNYRDWSIGNVNTTIPADDAVGRTVAGGYAQRLGYTSFSLHGIGTSNISLPISLLSFDGYKEGEQVHLNWATSSEVNNDFFTIERSTDGVVFETIGKIPGAGNSSTTLAYSFIDDELNRGTVYYRLSQTDYDGTREVFEMIAVHQNGNQIIELFPNPASNNLTITSKADTDVLETVQIYDTKGILVYEEEMNAKSHTINVTNLESGVYRIVIHSDSWRKDDVFVITK